MNTTLQQAKSVVWRAVRELEASPSLATCRSLLSPDSQWVVAHPVNELLGPDAVAERLLAPLRRALPDAERRIDLFFAGYWDGRIDGGAGTWVTCTGHYLGRFREPLWGIEPTGEPAWLRFGEFYRVEGEHIVEARILLDLVDLARQAGRRILPPSSGLELLVPGSRHASGILLAPQDAARGEASLRLVEDMIGGLGRYDQKDLRSMGMGQYWRDDMMWYGPCGIGTSRGIEGFQRHHQKPFLVAFPDRKGGHHRARFGEGDFVASTGWPSVRATHAGPYLGTPASDRAITMRVMDWWRQEDGLLAENWVLIDLPHLFLQMGVDLLEPDRRVG
ncbi:MAG: ester cyclase [Burkholderiaceae bacterium]|jgi:predicted ester cyclase